MTGRLKGWYEYQGEVIELDEIGDYDELDEKSWFIQNSISEAGYMELTKIASNNG